MSCKWLARGKMQKQPGEIISFSPNRHSILPRQIRLVKAKHIQSIPYENEYMFFFSLE